jgi:hypothetical protein
VCYCGLVVVFMRQMQNGRKSVFDSKKVVFSPNTKDDYFTTAYLERS